MASGELDFAADRWVRGAVPIPQRDYHFTLQGHDFGEGILNGGAGWLYSHGYSASHGVHSDEIRESSDARGRLDSSNGRRLKQGKTKEIACKFYVQGHCRHGLNCRYLHDSALETEREHRVPVAISVHTNGHSWYPHHNAPNNQMEPTTPVVVHTSAHVLSGYDRGNLNSAQRSQHYVFPLQDFGLQPPPLLIPSRISENGINIDKGHSSQVLGIQNGMHATNFATRNSQMHQYKFLAHPKRLGEYFVPQAGVHVPALSLQGQSSSQEAYAILDVSSHNGQIFNVNDQISNNLEAAVGSKETTGIPKHVQDSGTQSMQNTHNFQPVGANEPTQRQTLQEVSVAPYSRSANRVAASIYHDAAASEQTHIKDPYGKALLSAAPVGKQFSRRNRDPRLVTNSSAAPPSVPPIPHEATAISVPSAAPPPAPPIQQETRDDNTHPVDLSRSVEVTGHAAVPRIFKKALTNFVKEQLQKTWKMGHLTTELHKIIAQKVVEKVMHSAKSIHNTSQKAKKYLQDYRRKINELIRDYLKHYDVKYLQ